MMNNYANDTIFMVGSTSVMYSTNGGVGWTTLVDGNAAGGTMSDIRMINSTTAIAVGNVNESGGSFAPLIYTIDITATPPTATRMTLPSSFPASYGIKSLCSTYAPIFPVDKLVFGSNTSNGTLMLYDNSYYKAATNYPNFYGNNFINVRKTIYNGNTWLAVGNFTFGGYAFSSTDGMNWSGPNQLASNVTVCNIYWNGSMAVAVGGGTGAFTPFINYSYDMLTWTYPDTFSVIPSCAFSSVIHNGSTWVAAGYNAQNVLFIYTSLDGKNWTQSTDASILNTLQISGGVVPTLGLFEGTFILGTTQIISSSPDGIIWTKLTNTGPTSPFSPNFYIYQIMQMNNLLIVAGFDTTTNIYAYYSSDIGKTWTGVSGQPVGTNADIYLIFDMKMISPTTAMMAGVKGGTTALTLISTNGITWTRINNGSGLNQIYSFSGTYSEIVLNCDPPTTNTQIMGQANPNQRLTLSNKYTSNINAVPTYINIPYVNVTFPSGVTQIPITITLTQKSSTSTSSTPVATGTFTLLPANATTYTTTGISIPLKLESSSSYIVSGYTVTYTLSVTSDAIGTGSMQVQYNFGLTATLHGRTYFLPSTLTLPTATSGGTQWYIPSPIVYYPSKTIYGNKIKTSVPSIAANNGLITYTTTSTGTGSLGFGTYGTSSVEMLKLTLGSVPATINVIASYPGNNAYAATSVTTTVYSKDYIPVSPQTAMFLNKSGLTGSSANPTSIGNGGATSTAASIVVTINVTDNVTLNEFNFGCKSLLGLAGYYTVNNTTFTMTVKNGSTIVTTVVFTVIIPPPGAQGTFVTLAKYYAVTYEQNETNWGDNDGMLLSIPFYNISSDLPTYVTSFSVTGTPSPQFKLGDTIQISLAANAPFGVYTSYDANLCGALIATPAVNPSPYVPSIYNNPLPSIAYEGSDTYSSPAISTNTSIGICPAILVTAKTMLTGFLIENIGAPSVASTAQLQFVVYNQSTNVLAINIQCTLPVFNANPMRPLYIPFSYASQQNNTTANAIAIQYIAFSGTQNPIFEIGSNVSFRLISLNTSNTSYKYYSAGSPNYSTFVSTAYGTAMLANTNLAVTASVTPVQILINPKTIQFTSTTTPANVGSAITYASRISASIGSVNSSTGVLTIGGGNNNMVRATVTASQAAGPLYNPATASASVDIIGYSTTMGNIGTNTGSGAQSMTNNPSLNGYFIDVNIPLATTITGISFQYSGNMTTGSTPGNTTTIRMTLAKSNNPTAVLASTTFTYTDNYNTNDDGTLFIIPFVNGNAFNTDTYPITVMPTKILTVSGSVSTLAFDTGDAIRITLINASNPLTPNVIVQTATASPTNTTLACSVISTVTASSYPFTSSLFSYSPGSPITTGGSLPRMSNAFQSAINHSIQLTFPNFSTAIIATGFTIPVQMYVHGTYAGQLLLVYSGGGGIILVIDFILVSTSTMSSPYINLQFPFNMPIGNDMGSKTRAQNQYYTSDGGYYITNVTTQNTAVAPNINNGLANITSNPRLGSAAASVGHYYVLLGLAGNFMYQISPQNTNAYGQNAVYSLYGSALTTQN